MDKNELQAKEEKLQLYHEQNYYVVKANEIIQTARYELNITELKILAYVISKIKPADTELQEYVFTIKDFCALCNIGGSGKNYKDIKDTLKRMRDKSFWITDENGTEILVGWLAKAKINKGSGKIAVKLDEDLQKYLIGLYSNYTQYSLLSTLPMTSSYSFRIYELLKSVAYQKHYEVDIDELRRLLLVQDKYVNFKDFRRRILDIATTEINKYTDLEIAWSSRSKGRKVITVIFDIKTRDAWGQHEAAKRAREKIEGQGELSLEDF